MLIAHIEAHKPPKVKVIMTESNKDQPPELGFQQVTLPTHWLPLDDAPTAYANQLYVTFTGREFYLVFGELLIPLLTGNKESMPSSLQIRPVLKIAITPDSMIDFAKVIN